MLFLPVKVVEAEEQEACKAGGLFSAIPLSQRQKLISIVHFEVDRFAR